MEETEVEARTTEAELVGVGVRITEQSQGR